MEYIKGFTFSPFSKRGSLTGEDVYRSLDAMKERTNANFVIFAPNGLQQTAQSENISFQGIHNVTDEELIQLLRYAKSIGLRTALKPTANCKDGTWRAHINFFDEDVVCEPKWSNWFSSYTEFQLHYAAIAEAEKCEMFIAGCEMVMSERREKEWRELIDSIRNIYHGMISYNTDKYQEHNVKWWDCVDVISSSGYYPIDAWEKQLDRIECVVRKYNKPFFFAESGCMSRTGSKNIPNNWAIEGDVDLEGQYDWYQSVFESIKKREWLSGVAFWSWPAKLYSEEYAVKDKNYEIYLKPAEKVVMENFSK